MTSKPYRKAEHIFTADAPQFEIPEDMRVLFTAEEVQTMRDDFESQKLNVTDLRKAQGDSPDFYIDLEYKPWYSCQFTVGAIDPEIDVVFLKFVGTAS